MPLPILLAHKLSKRLAEVRKADVLPYLRPDGKTQVTVRYRDGRPVGVEKILISTQHADGIDSETLIKPDLFEHVLRPVLPAELYEEKQLLRNFLVNPTGPLRDRRADGRLRADGAQDHRRHLWRHGAPRRRGVLGQGSLQGGPLGGLRGAGGWRRTSSPPAWPTARRCRSRTRSGSRTRCR